MKVNDDLTIEIDYDANFKRQVRGEGRPYNPLVDFIIICEDVSLSGPERGYVDGYAINVLHGLLDAVEAVRLNERCVVSAPEDAVRFVFEPSGESVVLTICVKKECAEDTNNRMREIEPQATASKDKLVSEIFRTTHRFVDEVLEIDPSLRNNQMIRKLEQRLSNLEKNGK